jgi:membrane protease YdiL (CAAX protease family)
MTGKRSQLSMQQNSSSDQDNSKSPDKKDPVQDAGSVKMKIHPLAAILVALAWPMMGFFLCLVLQMIFKIDISKNLKSVINLAVGCFGVFYLFPVLYRAPFGAVPLRDYLKRIGLYVPRQVWRHVLLGIILAVCTLSGMLIGSALSGRYELNWSTINLKQILFSLNPGIFEEIFFRGIIVMLLLPLTKNLKTALAWQIAIFGLAHIKGLNWLVLVDIISVMIIAVAFTYSAYKTRTLVAGIVFHFLHDAFLFFVQVPQGEYYGWTENIAFYGFLWLMVAVACLIIRYAGERLAIHADRELYIINRNAAS